MAYNYILIETRERVGLVTLNRPQALNALNESLLRELMDALEAFDADPSVGAIVIAGSPRAFAAGADIKEMATATPDEMRQRDFIGLFERMRAIGKPIVAAVSGYALGGGCELALACDMIVASESSRFGLPEVTIGVIPGAGGTQRLTRALGKYLAMEVILNNRVLTAAEAYSFGLVNRVTSIDRWLEDALKLAGELAARAPLAVRAAKRMINTAYERSLSDGLAEERGAFYGLFATEDQKEGMAAFLEKRKPDWKGK